MTDVELLPLLEPLASKLKIMRFKGEVVTAEWWEGYLHRYARANLAHATAAKDAEIEALRVEVERLTERNKELEGFREYADLLKHKVITCGVAADHPDAHLTRTGAYASKWNSPQAERVRVLRDRAERLAEALRDMLDEYGQLHAKFDLGECQATMNARAALEQETTNG